MIQYTKVLSAAECVQNAKENTRLTVIKGWNQFKQVKIGEWVQIKKKTGIENCKGHGLAHT